MESEKFAALGGLVAGVAHEINTPVGVGVTAASFLEDRTNDILKRMDSDRLSEDDVKAFFNLVFEASGTILKNLGRAADLVRKFKQVAVDQSREVRRCFNLKEYIKGVLLSPKGLRSERVLPCGGKQKVICFSRAKKRRGQPFTKPLVRAF